MANGYKSWGMLDSGIALRLLYMLTTPFKENPLYKAGTIDEKGNYILPKNKRVKPEQRPTYLDRLVINVKKLINKLPAGENMLKNLLAAMILIKEGIETENPKLLEESVQLPNPDDVKYVNDKVSFYAIWEEYCRLKEEVGVGAIGGGSGMPANNVSSGFVCLNDSPLKWGVIRRKAHLKTLKGTK